MAVEQLGIEQVSKSYPGVDALREVSLSVTRGSIHALAGQNGAGKSTLVKILSGAEPPDTGSITVEGERVQFRSPQDAQRAGIQTIYQELSLVPQLSVAENIMLGEWPGGGVRPIDWKEMRRHARQALERVGFDLDVRRPVSSFSVAEQQGVELAKALHKNAKIVLLDEPTSALSPPDVDRLFRVLRQLAAGGVSLVYISHRMDELFALCDEVSVLRDGRKTATFATADSTRQDVVTAMVGQELSGSLAAAAVGGRGSAARLGGGARDGVLLSAVDIAEEGRVEGVSFDLRDGEVLGVVGLVGSGQSELAGLIAGARRRTGGSVTVGGARTRLSSPREAIKAGIGLLPQDRKAQGFVPEMSVTRNMTLASLPMFSRLSVCRERKERQLATSFSTKLGMRIASVAQPMRSLSGGNQQKAILARWLARSVRLLVCDEPTRGVDIGAKEDMYELLRDFVKDGGTVVIASSEISEALMCDRVLVMAKGSVVAEISHDEMGERGEAVVAALA